MTKREMLNAILNGEITDEVLAAVQAELDSMDKTNAKRAEKALSKSFRKQGYACSGFFTREVAGQEATGFGYSYEIQGITQSCETIVVQHGKCCYTLYYYTRAELAEANRAMYDALLASLSFA